MIFAFHVVQNSVKYPPKTKKRGIPPGEIEEKKKMGGCEIFVVIIIILSILGGGFITILFFLGGL